MTQDRAKIYGPGVWYVLHLLSYHANTLEKSKIFIEQLEQILSEFPCDNCRKHALKYLAEHRPEQNLHMVDNEGNMIGMFRWTWMFHNFVNSKLGKTVIDWETAIGLYEEITPCMDCGQPDSESITNGDESETSSLNNLPGRQSPQPLTTFVPPYSSLYFS